MTNDEESRRRARAYYLRRKPGPKPRDPEHVEQDRHRRAKELRGEPLVRHPTGPNAPYGSRTDEERRLHKKHKEPSND